MSERKGTSFMIMRHGAKVRRVAAAALAATALTVSLTACGSDADSGKANGGDAATAVTKTEKPKDDNVGGEPSADTDAILATMQGDDGLEIVIHSAKRDEGGFLTVSGTLKNTSGKQQYVPSSWSGQETQVVRTGRSLAGITLVDKAEKKRYYVLRDTDGYPLTTSGITGVRAGESISIFAQFPAPPESSSQVDLQLPTMPTATIAIS
ncbi:hypothetical protein [Streptomyces sp. NPDC088725]|uniref:hypothetical protein n=1 Tax=Streptomyces sp. NPDC088725 TaxID=3365873 RepID=UPI0037F29714